ncbi:SGNH/GDSL hydrolase family protein [Salinifilum aidingensis]
MLAAKALRLALLAAGAAGGLSGAAYGLLNGQSRHARRVIGLPGDAPLRADGVYHPRRDRGRDEPPAGSPEPLALAVLGDSSAAGLGVTTPAELPGVLIARELAEELDRPVALTTHAIVGTTSQGLARQVTAARTEEPELVLIIVGANDVTSRLPIASSGRLLGDAVRSFRADGVPVVAGTCPDLGAIRPIPQPLRAVASRWSLALAQSQRREVEAAGGYAVPLADLLSPEFLTRPGEFFSPDRFHPSAAGYEAATTVLLPALSAALGAWDGGPLPPAPTRSTAAEARRPTRRIVRRLNWRLHRAEGNELG